jgi:segregation and condensation protein B
MSADEENDVESEADFENVGDADDLASEDSISEENDSPTGFSLAALGKAYAKAIAGQQGSGEPELESIRSASPNEDPAVDGEGDRPGALQPPPGKDQLLDEDADNAPCPVSPKSILEAMLFVGTPDGQPLKNRNLAALMRGVSPKEITQLVKELNQQYEQEEAPYRIKREGSGYQMVLAEKYKAVREKFYGEVRHASLSQAAIDVLSIVAYNQPVTKEQVEKVRAKPSGAILLQLVRRQLLSREKTEAQPPQTLYTTSDRFLNVFGLTQIDELPQTHDVDLLD